MRARGVNRGLNWTSPLKESVVNIGLLISCPCLKVNREKAIEWSHSELLTRSPAAQRAVGILPAEKDFSASETLAARCGLVRQFAGLEQHELGTGR